MRRDRLDTLLWEQIPLDNFVMYGGSITQENLDAIPFETVDELKISRDSDYRIKVSCVGHPMRRLIVQKIICGKFAVGGNFILMHNSTRELEL